MALLHCIELLEYKCLWWAGSVCTAGQEGMVRAGIRSVNRIYTMTSLHIVTFLYSWPCIIAWNQLLGTCPLHFALLGTPWQNLMKPEECIQSKVQSRVLPPPIESESARRQNKQLQQLNWGIRTWPVTPTQSIFSSMIQHPCWLRNICLLQGQIVVQCTKLSGLIIQFFLLLVLFRIIVCHVVTYCVKRQTTIKCGVGSFYES